jgi:biopolymer transport protein ExbB/TolQ
MNMILLLTALTFAAEPAGEATEAPAQNKTSQEAPKEEAKDAATNPTEASTTSSTPSSGEQSQSQEVTSQETTEQASSEETKEGETKEGETKEGDIQEGETKEGTSGETATKSEPQKTQAEKLEALKKESKVEDAHGGSHFTVEAMWNQSSGPVRAVLLTLLFMMVACFGVAIERAMYIGRSRRESKELVSKIMPLLQKGDQAGAYVVASDDAFKNCYLGILLSAGLKEFDARQDDYGIDAVERALGKSNVTIGENLTEWFNILATTGATAPFVGLVGTIFGIINAFSMIGSDGGADLTTLAPAIGEALITTAFGIIVALVGVWLFNYFTAKVETVTNEVTRSAQDLIDWCHKQVEPPFDQKDAAK